MQSNGLGLDFPPTPSTDWNDDSTNTSFPNSPGLSAKRGKCGKGKGKLKQRASGAGSHKKGSKVANGDVPATPSSSNSNDSAAVTPGSSLHVKLPEPSYRVLDDFEQEVAPVRPNAYIRYMETPQEELADEVEYDLDEEDFAWLELINEKRAKQKYVQVEPEDMELLMDRLEKESHFQVLTILLIGY